MKTKLFLTWPSSLGTRLLALGRVDSTDAMNWSAIECPRSSGIKPG